MPSLQQALVPPPAQECVACRSHLACMRILTVVVSLQPARRAATRPPRSARTSGARRPSGGRVRGCRPGPPLLLLMLTSLSLPQRPARAACATFPVCRAVPRTASAPVLPRARRPLPPRPKRLQRESPLLLLLPPALAALVHTVLLHVLITLCHHPSPSTPTCAPSGAPHTSDVHQQNFIWPFDR